MDWKAIIAILMIFIGVMLLQWGTTCVILWAVCKLVGWEFSIKYATVAFLCLWLLSGLFKGGKSN